MINSENPHRGRGLALMASGFLVADGVLMLGLFGWVLLDTGFRFDALRHLLQNSPLPLAVYLSWALGIFGVVAAVATLALYGYRERWFWSCLMFGACCWLIFPPVHTVLGALALILLVRNRESFPKTQATNEPPP